MMYVLQNLHWFLILLGALVFFHELGHFLVAKACGVRVLKFSLGFGPRVLGFEKDGTEYVLSILPLGGYVKMLGEQPGMDVPPEEASRAFSNKPVWQRASIVAAGPVFNFILAFAVYLGMFTGMQTFGDTKLGIVSQGEPAWNAGLRPGDKILSVDGDPVDDWIALRDHIGSRPGQSMRVTYERNGEQRAAVIAPEAKDEANVFQETETRGRIGVSLQYVRPVVGVVDHDSPAAQGGLRTGDEVVRVGDVAVSEWYGVREAVAKATGPFALTYKREGKEQVATVVPVPVPELQRDVFSSADAAAGYTGLVSKNVLVAKVEPKTPAADMGLREGDRLLALTIEKDGSRVSRPIGVWDVDLAAFSGVDARADFEVTYQRGRTVKTAPLKLAAREEQDEFKNVRTQYVFGAENDADSLGTYTYERYVGPFAATKQAALKVLDDATLIGQGLAKLVQGRVPLDSMGGPIMLFVIAEKTAKRGATTFLSFLAIISVNLGVLNLLPIPVLDGGHLMFCAVEAIRRRPPSLRFREMANVFGLVLLLLLMVLVFKNDILRYVLG